MEDIRKAFGKPMTAKEYADEWEINSSSFEQLGYYKFAIEQLGECKKAIEIGAGSGRSTLALAKSGVRVAAIEINEFLADKAVAYLSGGGISSARADISKLREFLDGEGPQVTIFVGDIFSSDIDEAISGSSCDSIVCWFIGAHPEQIASTFGVSLQSFNGREMPEYRLKVQARAYDLGRVCLCPGGIVQVLDRMTISSWQDKNFARDHLAEMQLRVSKGGFEISRRSSFLKRAEANFKTSQIQYLAEQPQGGVQVVSSTRALFLGGGSNPSLQARRP
jgi:hypothetical protein